MRKYRSRGPTTRTSATRTRLLSALKSIAGPSTTSLPENTVATWQQELKRKNARATMMPIEGANTRLRARLQGRAYADENVPEFPAIASPRRPEPPRPRPPPPPPAPPPVAALGPDPPPPPPELPQPVHVPPVIGAPAVPPVHAPAEPKKKRKRALERCRKCGREYRSDEWKAFHIEPPVDTSDEKFTGEKNLRQNRPPPQTYCTVPADQRAPGFPCLEGTIPRRK